MCRAAAIFEKEWSALVHEGASGSKLSTPTNSACDSSLHSEGAVEMELQETKIDHAALGGSDIELVNATPGAQGYSDVEGGFSTSGGDQPCRPTTAQVAGMPIDMALHPIQDGAANPPLAASAAHRVARDCADCSSFRRRPVPGLAIDEPLERLAEPFVQRMNEVLRTVDKKLLESLPADVGDRAEAWRRLVASAVKAFTSMDLLRATRQLLANAKGSFGLVTSHSLESDEAVVVAARGQTMSIACYPQQGLVLFGSEVAATKVAMGTAINSSLLGGETYDPAMDASNRGGWLSNALDWSNRGNGMDSSNRGLRDKSSSPVGIRPGSVSPPGRRRASVMPGRASSVVATPQSASLDGAHHGAPARSSSLPGCPPRRASLVASMLSPAAALAPSAAARPPTAAAWAPTAAARAPTAATELTIDDFGDTLRGTSFRLDLDDVNGEVCELRWGHAEMLPPASDLPPNVSAAELLRYGPERCNAVVVMSYIGGSFEDGGSSGEGGSGAVGGSTVRDGLCRRMLQLDGNPLISSPQGVEMDDHVARDIAEIPKVLSQLQSDWESPTESYNRLTALTLTSLLKKRMLLHDSGEHDGSVDLLISGCEVSLWMGEQFAADLHRAFPKLNIVSLSANKLLAQLGQSFPIPQLNFQFHERSYSLTESPVLLISHSGGTFASLACSNLLKSFTSHIFAVTSEWDTQVSDLSPLSPHGPAISH